MGAPLSARFVALASRVPGAELHQHGGAHRLLAGRAVRAWLDASGTSTSTASWTRWAAVPADLVKAGFKLLKPTMDLSTNLNLWWNLWNDKYVEGFNALNKWANEYVAVPRRVLPPVGAGLLPGQQALSGASCVLGGRPVRPATHHVSGVRRWAPRRTTSRRPPACEPLIDAVGSRDKRVHRAARRPHLADRGPRRRGALLAQGRRVAGWRPRLVEEERCQWRMPSSTQLFDMWKRSSRRATQAWSRCVAQMRRRPRPAGPVGFWRPFMDQGLAAVGRRCSTQTPGHARSDDASGSSSSISGSRRGRKVLEPGHEHRGLRPDDGQAAGAVADARRRPVKKAAEQPLERAAGLNLPRAPSSRGGQADRRARGAAGAGGGQGGRRARAVWRRVGAGPRMGSA